MAFAAVIVRRRGYARVARPLPAAAGAWRRLVGAGWALLVPVIIIGGIVGGWFTPTEAGVIAVVYALLVVDAGPPRRCGSPTSRASSSSRR